ncbi:MAG: hypothetical protein CO108_14390 [Deltaproteobacteria bacterium CG_4_9_14_3_um_filter_63_12]|nr:MAG: hypothetical protein CO108_14390 [Deltaproteobacteria bacterium CG_4_9_14_3_um_filter_63_12]
MAQSFLGIDIGAKAIRLLRMAGSSRIQAELFHEEPIDPEGGVDGVEAALRRLAQAHLLSAEVVAVSLPSGAAMVTRLSLPFSEAKIIEQVLPGQLTGKLPVSEDYVLDFSVLDRRPGNEGELHDIQVVAYPKDLLGARLEMLSSIGCDPQIAIPMTFVGDRLARYLYPNELETYAILDIGDRGSRLIIMKGLSFQTCRSFLVGGRSISEAVASAFGVSVEVGEQLKEEQGFVAPEGEEVQWFQQLVAAGAFDRDNQPDSRELTKATRAGLRPLLTALRQSLVAHSNATHDKIDHVVLAGGGARLKAIAPYLAQSLSVDVRPIRFEREELVNVAPNPLAQPEMAGALALALRAAELGGNELDINLRTGDYGYKGTIEFIKERALGLSILVALLVLSTAFMLFTRYQALSAEKDQLQSALEESTTALFGRSVLTEEAIKAELQAAKGYSFIPERTAFDHFQWISDALTNNMVGVNFEFDTLEIDVMRKVVSIKGDTDADAAVPMLTSVLEQYDCFPNDIPEPTTDKNRGRTGFKLRIEANHCYANSGEDD